MQELWDSIVLFAATQWEFILFVGTLAFFRKHLREALKEKSSRLELVRFVKTEQLAGLYQRAIENTLDRFASYIGESHRPIASAPHSFGSNWSGNLFDFTLFLSILYPTSILVLYWTATGSHLDITGIVLLGGELSVDRDSGQFQVGPLPVAERTLYAVTVFSSFLFAWFSCLSGNRFGKVLLSVGAMVIAGVAVILGTNSIADYQQILIPGHWHFSGPMITLVACSSAVVASAAQGHRGKLALGTALVLVILLNFLTYGWLEEEAGKYLASWLSLEPNWLMRWVMSQVLIASCFVAAAVVVLVAYPQICKYASPILCVAGFLLIGVSMLAGINQPKIILAFATVVPILNALFDFLSIGFTRWTLARGATSVGRNTVKWALMDLIGKRAAITALATAVAMR